jgi:hypothetical protein
MRFNLFKSEKEKRADLLKYIDSMFVTEKELKLEVLRLMKYIDHRIKDYQSNPNTPCIEDQINNHGEDDFTQKLEETQLETNLTQENDETVDTNSSVVDAVLIFLGIKKK